MGAKIGQPGACREPVDDHVLGRARQHGLPAMGQIAQPRGAVDGRAGVVVLIAQLHLPGMHPDAQPDRCQRCPLQLQRARHRVAGARERDHEAIALALFDRPHTVMVRDDVAHRTIQSPDRGRHLLGLGLPQPRGALDIGQQQCHRSGRQLAHAWVAPVHRRRIRTWINFAHANRHVPATGGNT